MSKREAVLCDKERCDHRAIGKCRLCDADICDDHALCEAGGLTVTVELRQLQAGQPRKPPRGQSSVPVNYERVGDPNMGAVLICGECASCLQSNTSENGYKMPYKRALAAITEGVVETLRAAMAADAMGKGPQRGQ